MGYLTQNQLSTGRWFGDIIQDEDTSAFYWQVARGISHRKKILQLYIGSCLGVSHTGQRYFSFILLDSSGYLTQDKNTSALYWQVARGISYRSIV